MAEAPRWSLRKAHYLKIAQLPDGTKVEWEHKETNRDSGRTNRKIFAVPMYLNSEDASDCNYPGECIVAHKVEGCHNLKQDYIFEGEPNQEMEPLNEAAQAITDSLRAKWIHPIDTIPVNGGMNSEEMAFMAKMMEAAGKVASATVPKADYDALAERLARLEALLSPQGRVVEPSSRRV